MGDRCQHGLVACIGKAEGQVFSAPQVLPDKEREAMIDKLRVRQQLVFAANSGPARAEFFPTGGRQSLAAQDLVDTRIEVVP